MSCYGCKWSADPHAHCVRTAAQFDIGDRPARRGTVGRTLTHFDGEGQMQELAAPAQAFRKGPLQSMSLSTASKHLIADDTSRSNHVTGGT